MSMLMLRYILKKIFFLPIVFCFLGCTGDSLTYPSEPKEPKMYVYSNSGNTFYLLNYKTYEVIKEITLPVVDTISYDGMAISTNRDNLLFGAIGKYPNPPFGFAVYDVKKDTLKNIFFTELRSSGGYFISAENEAEPGLVYVHCRDLGTYSIDLFEQKVKEFISSEHDFVLDKRIFHSPDGKWTLAKKNWSGNIRGSYTELEFYTAGNNLHNLQFVLNQNDKDSIEVYDLEFSNDNRLYITYQLSNGRSRDKESYFGSYDINTKKLFRSSLKFPWSLNPYYTAYSPIRDEVYTIGAYDKFYIIDANSYEIRDTISLVGKATGSSQIIITPDEDVAFVSCPSSNAIFVINLNNRQVVNKINLTKPYNMIIP